MTEAQVSERRMLLAWRVGLGIFSFAAATGLGLAILLAVRGFWPGVGIFTAVTLFEVWRAVTLYRKKPEGVTVDMAMDLAQRNARLRVSAWVVTVCAIGCAILAALVGRVELWLIGGLLGAGAALVWVTALWLIPRAIRTSAGS
jgi:hypothetical protein